MAIDKKFIHFKTYENFISHNGIGSEANITTPTEGSEDTGDAIYGQIKGSSVVFIKDVQKMWTHGQLYDCSGGNMSEQDPVFMASPAATITETKKTEWDSKQNTISDLETIRSGAEKGATAVQPSSLATVATSGSYNDLSNKPTIPSVVTESTVSGWGFTKNAGTYSKPSGGIPKSDLTSEVQTSLGKADSAYDLANGKQDKLVSGTNIKTINGTSILGSGDITISGGSDANVQAVDTGDVLDDVNVEYATKTYVDNKVANISLTDYATIAYVDGLVGDINSVLESIISGGGSVSLITFTIVGTEYQAEEGMTWEQWINSEYNAGSEYINNSGYVGTSISGIQGVYDSFNNRPVVINDIIRADYGYTISSLPIDPA